MAKNQTKAKQHLEAELLLFENYSLSKPTLSFKNNSRYILKYTKNKYPWGYMINDNKNEYENEK